MPRRNIVQEICDELIDYGGIAAKRHEAYSHAYASAKSKGAPDDSARRCGDLAAFSRPSLTPEEASRLIPWSTALSSHLL